MNGETRILRSRHSARIATLDRLDDPVPTGNAKFLGTVINAGSIPTTADHFCLSNPTDIGGAETEGGTVSFTPDTDVKIPGIVLGAAPVVGDRLVFSAIGGRWIARKRGGSGGGTFTTVAIPTCFCTQTPTTLTMTSCDTAANFNMFQPCTIQYGPTPAVFGPLNLGSSIFLSTASFPDPVAGGALFYYHLICHTNQFSLTRLYPTSPYGSPYRDGILYSWLLGAVAIQCADAAGRAAFNLSNGSPFPGSDPTACVTLYGGGGSFVDCRAGGFAKC